jgi:hypothetical protein
MTDSELAATQKEELDAMTASMATAPFKRHSGLLGRSTEPD